MAVTCPRCRDDLVQPLAGDTYQCLACSQHFDSEGNTVNTSIETGAEENLPTGPPPAEDPSGKYDHTGPYPTPAHATPPNPGDAELETQADLDAAGATVDPGDEEDDK